MNTSTLSLAGALFALAVPLAAASTTHNVYHRLPLSFERNDGQTSRRVDFISRGPGYTLFLQRNEAVFRLREGEDRSSVLRMKVVGASKSGTVTGLDLRPAKSNYFIGNDSSKWRTDIPQYARVRYSEIYPGIDLVYYGNQRQLEYDFVVSPGADPRKIELAFDGADSMRVEANGDLVLRTGTQETRQHRPVVYQKVDGTRRVIDGRYRLVGSKRIRFDVAEYRRDLPLVIDPVLSYSTYLGGSGEDVATSVAVDASGNAYVTGSTTSVNFPATTGVVQASNAGQQDVL